MKLQQPAEGILLQKEYDDAKIYTITCECGSTECYHNVWVEADNLDVTVTTFTHQKSKWWSFNRFQLIWTLLTKGYVEYEASIIMSKQQALNYAETLKSAIKDIEPAEVQK